MEKLKSTSFKKNVITEWNYSWQVLNLSQIRSFVVSFEDGVYDLDKSGIQRRCICRRLGFNYGISYYDHDDDDENLLEVHKFINEVLPRSIEVCPQVFINISSLVQLEKVPYADRVGRGGKSKLIDLFSNSFRDYCCPLPVSHLTRERGRSEGANSALATTKNKLFCSSSSHQSAGEELKGSGES